MSEQAEDRSGTATSDAGHEEMHQHAGGDISERPGRVNRWLWLVYAILFGWSLYYLIVYWGGLGPGLDY